MEEGYSGGECFRSDEAICEALQCQEEREGLGGEEGES